MCGVCVCACVCVCVCVCETKYPGFSSALLDVANALAGAHPKRQDDSVQLPLSLDDLVSKLDKAGFKVKRSTTYLRLLPHRSSNLEGQKHIRTVPVRLAKPENNDHKAHQDTAFAKQSIDHLEELAGLLGPSHVFYLGQDDKCRISLGITAAQKQQAVMMHVEYRIKLPGGG